MRDLRVLDLDGSLAAQASLFPEPGTRMDIAREWGPQVRLACSFASFASLPALAWTKALGRWGRASPAMARETFTTLPLPSCERISGHSTCLSWTSTRTGCGVFPSCTAEPGCGTRFGCRKSEPGVPLRWRARLRQRLSLARPLARDPVAAGSWSSREPEICSRPVGGDRCPTRFSLTARAIVRRPQTPCSPFRGELERFPLYISIDKDVLRAEDAAVNWDSGSSGCPKPWLCGDISLGGRRTPRRRGRAWRLVADRARPLPESSLRLARSSEPTARAV